MMIFSDIEKDQLFGCELWQLLYMDMPIPLLIPLQVRRFIIGAIPQLVLYISQNILKLRALDKVI